MSRSSGHGRRTEDVLEAARSGTAAEVEESIHLGADLCGTDQQGMTALHFAASRGNLATIEVLLQFGAPLNVQDNAGMSPLHSAVIHDREKVAMRLIAAGSAVDVADLRGYTPLHLAASTGQLGLVQLLVEVGGCSLVAKTRLQLTPMMCAVEKRHCETMRWLADAQTPAFVLPAEPVDFDAACPPPSATLAKFLKTVPPRPAQAITQDPSVRAALGPRSPAQSAAPDAENAKLMEDIRRRRAAALAQLEADHAAEESAAAAAAAATAAATEAGRSEMWTSRRAGAAVLTSAVRRRLARADFSQPHGPWATWRAIAILASAMRRAVYRARHAQALEVVWAAETAAAEAAARVLSAALRRVMSSGVLAQRRRVWQAAGARFLGEVLRRSVCRRSYEQMAARARAAMAVLAPRFSATLRRNSHACSSMAQRRLAAAVCRAAWQRSPAHVALCLQRLGGHALGAAVGRAVAQTCWASRRVAATELLRVCGAAAGRQRWIRRTVGVMRLQACIRRNAQAAAAAVVWGQAVMERCCPRERRRALAQRMPRWQQKAAVTSKDVGEAGCVELVWLPCFAADDVDGAGGGGECGRGKSSAGERAAAAPGTRPRMSPALALGSQGADGSVGAELIKNEYEEEVKLCLGSSIRMARPLSSAVVARPPSTAGAGVGREGCGDEVARPMTSGGSRNADVTADCEQIVKRWSAAASGLALIADEALATAAIKGCVVSVVVCSMRECLRARVTFGQHWLLSHFVADLFRVMFSRPRSDA